MAHFNSDLSFIVAASCSLFEKQSICCLPPHVLLDIVSGRDHKYPECRALKWTGAERLCCTKA
jgi:hypothetical protein